MVLCTLLETKCLQGLLNGSREYCGSVLQRTIKGSTKKPRLCLEMPSHHKGFRSEQNLFMETKNHHEKTAQSI